MFLHEKIVDGIDSLGRKRQRIIYVCECDTCKKEYMTRNAGTPKRIVHSCSKECQRLARSNGGALQKATAKTNLERYGAENAFASEHGKEKSKKTNLERYGSENVSLAKEIKERKKKTAMKNHGVAHPMQSDEIREKAKQTSLERYGVAHPMQSFEVQEKYKQTNLERYGTEHIFASEHCKEKSKQTSLERYGVAYPTQSSEIREKSKQTNLERYGVENVFASECAKNKIKETMVKHHGVENPSQSEEIKLKKKRLFLKKYGVEHPFQSKEVKEKIDYNKNWQKSHQTKKLNGAYKTSKIENGFYEELVKIFGVENVERCVLVQNKEIDFYIRTINLYVELDGVYWHGLDRPIEQIELLKSKRDAIILRHYSTDRDLESYAKSNGMKLLRITDKEYKKWLKTKLEFSYQILVELAQRHPHAIVIEQ
jgi:hypothetical protein